MYTSPVNDMDDSASGNSAPTGLAAETAGNTFHSVAPYQAYTHEN